MLVLPLLKRMMCGAKKSPFRKHPLFHLRRCLLFVNGAGVILCVAALVNLNDMDVLPIFAFVLFIFSTLLVQADLADWKHNHSDTTEQDRHRCKHSTAHKAHPTARATTSELAPLLSTSGRRRHGGRYSAESESGSSNDPDDAPTEYRWPRKSCMIFDFVFAVLSFDLYCNALSFINFSQYRYGNSTYPIFQTYISVCTLLAALIHTKSWWIEFMARKKHRWEDERQKDIAEQAICDVEASPSACRCQHGEEHRSPPEESHILRRILGFLGKEDNITAHEDENNGPSCSMPFPQAALMTPEGSSSDIENVTAGDEFGFDSYQQRDLTVSPEASRDVQHDDATLVSKKKSKKGKQRVERA